MLIYDFDPNDPYYRSEEYRKYCIEILDDLFAHNHDMTFIYKGEEMFLSFAIMDDGSSVRGIFKWPGGNEPIILFPSKDEKDVRLDGKSFYELVGEIVITSVY